MKSILRLSVCFLILSYSGVMKVGAQKKPNFVIIFTDDQGYADLGCFGGQHVNTPRIDQMAEEGIRLTSFYVAAPVCTPSRAALMTGCYPKRIDMAMGSSFGVLLAADPKGLNPEEVTIAELLKIEGYKTGMFGKWHLGDHPSFMPTNQGFDEFFGIPYSHNIHPFHPNQSTHHFPSLPLLDGEKVIEMNPDMDQMTQRITKRAVQFIEDNKENPFFLYIPNPMPHTPLHASEEYMVDVSTATKEMSEGELLQIEKASLLKKGEKITEAKEKEMFDKIKNRYDNQVSPYYAASRIWTDAVINPLDTRTWISMGIEAANHAPIEKPFNMGVLQV